MNYYKNEHSLRRMRNYFWVIGLAFIPLFLCKNIGELFYEPPVVLVCYINGEYDSLAGNFLYPNSCELIADTLRMYFYSTDFSESNNIRDGDLIRLDIFQVSGNVVGTRNVLFHMARYHEGNASYTVNPADTIEKGQSVQMHIDVLERRLGGVVRISEFSVVSDPIGGTYGEALIIKDGRIEGHI